MFIPIQLRQTMQLDVHLPLLKAYLLWVYVNYLTCQRNHACNRLSVIRLKKIPVHLWNPRKMLEQNVRLAVVLNDETVMSLKSILNMVCCPLCCPLCSDLPNSQSQSNGGLDLNMSYERLWRLNRKLLVWCRKESALLSLLDVAGTGSVLYVGHLFDGCCKSRQ